jgi:GT2 family glycosyltransferase
MDRKISLCIPGYRRPKLTMETLAYPISDDMISEIIITDDLSPIDEYHELWELTKDISKVKLIRNVNNFHNAHNKRTALSFATNEWVILIDNDNKIDKNFVDKLFQVETWDPKIIYHPEWLRPHYDYREISGSIINKENVALFTKYPFFVTTLNSNNYLVHRNTYLKVYQYNPEVRGADGEWFMLNWFNAGNSVYILPGLQYDHLVHQGSEFLREVDSNMEKIYYYFELIKQLK